MQIFTSFIIWVCLIHLLSAESVNISCICYLHGSISRVDAKTIDALVLLCWIAKSMMASFTESMLPNVNINSATEANMKCQITVYVKLFSGI